MPAIENNFWDYMLKGDKNAFLTIYNNFYNALFKYGFSLTADRELTKDCIQEMFLEIWHTRATVSSGILNVRAYLFTWLRRKISRTIALKAREKTVYETDISNYSEAPYEELLIAFQADEIKKERLARALENLTKKQKSIIRMKFFDNLSYEDIALKTSLTTRTVYNTIYEALRHLREDVGQLI